MVVSLVSNMYDKQKLIFASIIFLFSIFQNKVYASPPAHAPRCYIEGIIQEMTYMNASNDSPAEGATDRVDIPER